MLNGASQRKHNRSIAAKYTIIVQIIMIFATLRQA